MNKNHCNCPDCHYENCPAGIEAERVARDLGICQSVCEAQTKTILELQKELDALRELPST